MTNRKTHWVISAIGTVVLLRVTIIHSYAMAKENWQNNNNRTTTKKQRDSIETTWRHAFEQPNRSNQFDFPLSDKFNIIWFICYSLHAVFVCALPSSIDEAAWICMQSITKARKKLDRIIIRANPKSQLYKNRNNRNRRSIRCFVQRAFGDFERSQTVITSHLF